jgi:ribonuclease R
MRRRAAEARAGMRAPDAGAVRDALALAPGPLGPDDLAAALGVSSRRARARLERALAELESHGEVIRDRRGRYGTRAGMHLVRGTVSAHPDGFGFVVPDEGGADLFLPPREMRAVLDGDRVLARVTGTDARGRRQGTVAEVIERRHRRIVGHYRRVRGAAYLEPHDRRIAQDVLLEDAPRDVADGTIVEVELTRQPDAHTPPLGRVIEVLGANLEPGMEVTLALRKHELPHRWSEAVLAQARTLPQAVRPADRRGRADDTALPFLTIDGEDARDFDDAVCAIPQGRGWRLLVAIADVGDYLLPGSALDEAARERGTSVYFPDHVVPMLPEALSNELCSLRPEVERLVLVCDMRVSARGVVTDYAFRRSRIVSRARTVYETVTAALAGDAAAREEYRVVVPELERLGRLYRVLERARAGRGVVEFSGSETRIVLGPGREVLRVEPRAQTLAHRIIEECMIAANTCAARYLSAHELPTLYRVHAPPDPERVASLRAFLGALGLALGGGDAPTPADYAALLGGIEDRPDRYLIETVVLRSLRQARYEAEETGHFGLALGAYAHFTSPIRRYPDLLVHRGLVHLLADRKAGRFPYTLGEMAELGAHCSFTERRADDAAREVHAFLKCQYLKRHEGEVMAGRVSGVAPFGLFVTLEGAYADGLIHITALPRDYYQHDPVHHRLRGERTRRSYRLGDRLEVRVVRVDLDTRKVDLVLAGEHG